MQYVSGPNIESREIFLFDKNLDGAVNPGTYAAQDMERILRRARACYAGNKRLNPIAGQLSDKYVLTSTRYGQSFSSSFPLATLATLTAPLNSMSLPGGTTTDAQDASGYNAHGGTAAFSANICLTPFSASKPVTPPALGFINNNVNPSFNYYLNVPLTGVSTAGAATALNATTTPQLMANGVEYPVKVSKAVPADYSYFMYGGTTYTGNAGNAAPTFPKNDGLTVVVQTGTAEQVNITDGLFFANSVAYKIDSTLFSAAQNLTPGSRPSITFNGYFNQWDITAM